MNRRSVFCAALASLFIGAMPAHAAEITLPSAPPGGLVPDPKPPTPRPFGIVREDASLDAIVDPKAKLELLGDRFGNLEGPVWRREGKSGYLLVSDMASNVLYRIDPDKKVSVYLDKAGYSGSAVDNAGIQTIRGRVAILSIGPSCASTDPQGRLVWCAPNDGAVMRLEPDGTRTVVASKYQGKRFDGPNDLAIKSNGSIYFADTDAGLRYKRNSPLKELPYTAIFLVRANGEVVLLKTDAEHGGWPNGIALSPDEKHLYVTSGAKRLLRYDVQPDDTITNGQLFAEGDGIGDGVKVDSKGNVYTASGGGPGNVRIMSPEGKLLGMIHLPVYDTEPRISGCAANLAFGEPDGKTLFIVGCEAAYKIRLRVPGIVPGPRS